MTGGTGRRSARLVFVGLGRMGFHLVRHVAAAASTRDVVVSAFDTDARARERTSSTGIETVGAVPTDLGDGDIVCLSVPDGRAVRAVIAALGPLERARGLTVLDFSSVAPADARAIAAELAPLGVRYVDAPVTGGVVGAELGTMTTVVGAEAPTIDALRWIPDAFSSRVVFAGAVGAGALLKSLNNMIGNVAAIASMEGIIVARQAGIADDVLLDVFNHGTAVTYFSQVRYPKYVASGRFDAGMRVGLVDKDLQIALDAAAEAGCDIRLCVAGRRMWADALDELGPDADTTMMMDVVARATAGQGVRELLGIE